MQVNGSVEEFQGVKRGVQGVQGVQGVKWDFWRIPWGQWVGLMGLLMICKHIFLYTLF